MLKQKTKHMISVSIQFQHLQSLCILFLILHLILNFIHPSFYRALMSASKQTNAIMQKIEPLFFLLLFLSFKLIYCVACPEIEKQSLLYFKQSLQDPLNMLSSWSGEVNCCKWKGVICSNLTGQVLQLHLQNYDSPFQGLSGVINPSLLNLKHLKYLDLSQNNFNETIPPFIGSLTSLEHLDFSGAGFYGNIPSNIGNLSNLHTLSLEGYAGSLLDVDNLEWLLGLSRLEHLNLNRVNLSKAANWPQVINKLPSLVELHLGSCSLNNFRFPLNDSVNTTHSNLAILDLYDNDFESLAIMGWVFQLGNLIYLDLSQNTFEGPIPSIANTTKLQHIDLSSNNFNSAIPEWLYLCKDLEFIDLEMNNLQNAISSSIGNLTSLNVLDLSNNELSGKIPREITNLCKTKTLFLYQNKFEGAISDSFGNMSDCFLGALESLFLYNNQLSGHLTNQFGEFRSLRTLDLGGNKLTGNLPESMGKLYNLRELDIENNMLEGVVTETHFAHLSGLKVLSGSGNHLTLKVSPTWAPPFKLYRLRLGSWNLGSGSPIPSWLETQKRHIFDIDFSCTGITGIVPRWILSIRFLNLSHNQLHGNIPVIHGPKDREYGMDKLIYLSSNKFSGPLPLIENTITELDLSNNSFSGGMSHFLCDTKTTDETYNLRILHLGGNHLSGELPDCWMKWPSLIMLNLANNNLSGTIPDSIGFLADLLSLNLFGNKFSGNIPSVMQNCTNLVKMDLSDNHFDGSIPAWIGRSLFKLRFLILRSNKLSGEITSAICQLSSLQILDLSNNTFSGVIPRCVDNFTAMATKRSLSDQLSDVIMDYSSNYRAFIESVSIATKGCELQYDTILSLVTSIDLSKNNLSGDIPKELTGLVELESLNLSGNQLTGLIPDSIGNMKQIESLDFSRNLLSGEIPISFTIMSSLNYVNLSYNNLTGRIPESTQLWGFNESSFIGNNLCGPPLTNSCNNDGKSTRPTHTEDQDQESDETGIEWLYVFMSLGYAVGLSAFFTTLLLKKTWKEAYNEFLEDMWDNIYVYLLIKWRRLKRALG